MAPLLVVGAGFGRTGTLSLKRALEQLGFGPTYHMEEVFRHPSHVNEWHRFATTGRADWDHLFAAYRSAVDFPASCAWRELADHYPDAKVILSVRDPQRWWQSTSDTIYPARTMLPGWLQRCVPVARRFVEMNELMIWRGLFDGRFADRQYATARFDDHTRQVRAAFDAERLLVFDVAEGWMPLCRFLGVPEPSHPFPRLNDTVAFQRRTNALRTALRVLPLAVVGAIFVGGFRVVRAVARSTVGGPR